MSRVANLLVAILVGVICFATTSVALGASVSSGSGSSITRVATAAHSGVKASAASHSSAGATHPTRHNRTNCRNARKHRRRQPRRCVAATRSRHGHANQNGRTAAPASRSATVVSVKLPPPSATIARVLATPCENTELMPEAGNLEAVSQATLCLINQERARNDELPLQANAKLTLLAEQHSEDMIAKDYFSHTTPSGETQLERVLASGYVPNSQVGYTIGENIAWGTIYLATPSSIVAAWIASPEHLANILNSEYRETGMGIDPAAPAALAEGQPGAIYTQEFGVIVE